MRGPQTRAGASTWSHLFVISGLIALSFTQPVLDLLGQNPEFFVAGRYTTGQIVAFGVIVALVPSALAGLVVLAGRVVHPRVGRVAYGVLLVALGALFGNVLARGLGLDGALTAVVASVLGAVGAVALTLVRPGRMLLELLALANVFFLVSFLVVSPTSGLLAGPVEGDLGLVSVPRPPGPVVVVIFDELPITTLLRPDGSINAERYPAFAALAAGSTWYRNASAVHNRTERSVPAILSGTVLEAGQLPTYRDVPRNLLTLMSTEVPVRRYEAITDLCPPGTCAPPPAQPLSRAFKDALTVYRHRVLPEELREGLPRIDAAWGGFGEDLGEDAIAEAPPPSTSDAFASGSGGLARWRTRDEAEQSPGNQTAELVRQGLAIDGSPELRLVHIVAPHAPWVLTPQGTNVIGPLPDPVDDPQAPNYADGVALRYQRHSMQVGAADAALGEVLDHLREIGAWDDSTIVVTADHGTSFLPPNLGRDQTETNRDEIFRVPLFIKAPGQAAAEVVDDVALGIDVLPTLIDLLGIETDWTFDGHSLLDGSEPTVEPYVSHEWTALLSVTEAHGAQFPRGDGWDDLAAVGTWGALVGTSVDDLAVDDPSDLDWAPDHAETFDSLPTDAGGMPQIVTGRITGTADPPPELVVTVDGTVAGVTRGYQRDGDGWLFFAVLGPYLHEGANRIEAFEVTDGASGPALHPVG